MRIQHPWRIGKSFRVNKGLKKTRFGMNSIGRLTLSVLWCVAASAFAMNDEAPSGAFEAAVSLARENRLAEAHAVLNRLTDDEVITQGLEFVRSSEGTDDRLVQFCYRALLTHGAEE